jgi:O-antigen/teichoic acid export membrane protein
VRSGARLAMEDAGCKISWGGEVPRFRVRDSIRHVGALTAGQMVALVTTLALTPLQLRGMGNAAYGVVTVSVSLVSYLSFLDIGSGWALARYVPRFAAAGDRLGLRNSVSAAVIVSVCTGGVAAVAVWLTAPVLVAQISGMDPALRDSAVFACRAAAVLLIVTLLLGLCASIASGLGMFTATGCVSTGNVVAFNGIWALVAHRADAVRLVVIAQIAVGCCALLYWCYAFSRLPEPVGPLRLPPREAFAQVLGFGGFSALGQLGIGLALNADKLALATAVPAEDVVFYSLSFSLAARLFLVSGNVNSVVFPRLSVQEGRPEARDLMLRSASAVSAITGSLVACCAVGGRDFLGLWLGDTFAERAAGPLTLLALAFGLIACTSIFAIYLESTGRVRVTAALHVVWGLAVVLGVHVGGRLDGVHGAAVAVAIAACGLSTALAVGAHRVGAGSLTSLASAALLPLAVCLSLSAAAVHVVNGQGHVVRLMACAVGAAAGLAVFRSSVGTLRLRGVAPSQSTDSAGRANH